MKSFSKIQSQFVAITLVVVVGFLIANKGIYIHSHRLADGRIISHAHPYNKTDDSSPFKQHPHTNSEFLILSQLELLFFLAFIVFTISVILKKQNVLRADLGDIYSASIVRKHGRSPPVVSFNALLYSNK
ncbi:MAG: hypothetical protein MI975_22705 [Cytophagales bacterium]|nr:hypothetical protein [Cytophagales bacterium]